MEYFFELRKNQKKSIEANLRNKIAKQYVNIINNFKKRNDVFFSIIVKNITQANVNLFLNFIFHLF
jgi:hypothetical protein